MLLLSVSSSHKGGAGGARSDTEGRVLFLLLLFVLIFCVICTIFRLTV